MLIGRNAPVVVDLQTRATFATNVWDFFKPKMDSEYPEVDGALSESCYFEALDRCYLGFLEKQAKVRREEEGTGLLGVIGKLLLTPAPAPGSRSGTIEGIDDVDFFLFHSPYNKLVQKSFARVLFHDVRAKRQLDASVDAADLSAWTETPLADTYRDKALEGKLKVHSKAYYSRKVAPGAEAGKRIGNTYTASVYMNLAWLLSSQGAALAGKNVVLFSYGSGAMATMLNLRPNSSASGADGKFSLATMAAHLNMEKRLSNRLKREPSDLDAAMTSREASDAAPRPFAPTYSTHSMALGTYYLAGINEKHQRSYAKKTTESAPGSPESMSPPRDATVTTDDDSRSRTVTEDFNTVATTTMPIGGAGTSLVEPIREGGEDTARKQGGLGGSGMSRNKTYVWASGRPNVRVVVTGVAAALPGRDAEVFAPGVNNIHRIIEGENCISAIPEEVRDAMLEKNVVLLQKNKQTGVNTKVPVTTHGDNINVNASLGSFDLTQYGVSASIAATMDSSVQVAVAAGLEALKDAGIITGEGPHGWVLPANLQATTGVVYATSFPALDSTIAEVSRFFKTKITASQHIPSILQTLREKLTARLPAGEALSADTEQALQALSKDMVDAATESSGAAAGDATAETKPAGATQDGGDAGYEFDRKFLFRVLVLGNAQLAQIIKARGPNMQTNAACAGSTQAVALAFDMIQVGRAERMIVVAGDNAASDTLMPWLGNGFRALGAATTSSQVELAAIPFDKRRRGMILGAGGIGMVLESEEGARRRYALSKAAAPEGTPARAQAFKCRLLGTLFSNSAYHGASLDKDHIALEMERFVSSVESEMGISRADLAKHGVYFSHETSTYASATSSCASNELHGLRKVFGSHFKDILICNTKGFTGHPMGVSFEDVVAAEVLTTGRVPPIANFTPGQSDPNLGEDLNLSRGGAYPCKYAIRFAAGFGSQIALALYGRSDTLEATE